MRADRGEDMKQIVNSILMAVRTVKDRIYKMSHPKAVQPQRHVEKSTTNERDERNERKDFQTIALQAMDLFIENPSRETFSDWRDCSLLTCKLTRPIYDTCDGCVYSRRERYPEESPSSGEHNCKWFSIMFDLMTSDLSNDRRGISGGPLNPVLNEGHSDEALAELFLALVEFRAELDALAL